MSMYKSGLLSLDEAMRYLIICLVQPSCNLNLAASLSGPNKEHLNELS